jgi:hypothetical protein
MNPRPLKLLPYVGAVAIAVALERHADVLREWAEELRREAARRAAEPRKRKGRPH